MDKLNEKEKQLKLELNNAKSELESNKHEMKKWIDRCDELKVKNNTINNSLRNIKSEYLNVANQKTLLTQEVGVLRLKLEQ